MSPSQVQSLRHAHCNRAFRYHMQYHRAPSSEKIRAFVGATSSRLMMASFLIRDVMHVVTSLDGQICSLYPSASVSMMCDGRCRCARFDCQCNADSLKDLDARIFQQITDRTQYRSHCSNHSLEGHNRHHPWTKDLDRDDLDRTVADRWNRPALG